MANIEILDCSKALIKSDVTCAPNRALVDFFKTQLDFIKNSINPKKTQERNKNIITKFLERVHYSNYYINTIGINDLVIRKQKGGNVNVILKTESLKNKNEFPTKDNLNVRSFHELILYYLEEKVDNRNNDIKNLIITNGLEWYIIDGNFFYETFYANTKFKKQYKEYNENRTESKKTSYFYDKIAKPFINTLDKEIEVIYFDLNKIKDDRDCANIYNILSPEFLLKKIIKSNAEVHVQKKN